MKNKVFYFILISIFFLGCATSVVHNLNYDIVLKKVEKPDKAEMPQGEFKISETEEMGYKYKFEDQTIKTLWFPTPKQVLFSLENKTDRSIKIIWEEVTYICEKGRSHRVIHMGVKYESRNVKQMPAVINPWTKVKEFIYPADYVSYVDDRWAERPGWSGLWVEKPLFIHTRKGGDANKFLNKAKKNIGKKIQVLLPIESENVKKIYRFTFLIEDVNLKKNKQ